jgi:glycosyltransferase involved in cell wall biosynthesis
MVISVIITTYNSPHYLQLCLTGFKHQTYKDFEIVVADDGSSDETKAVIDRFRIASDMQIKHVWHEDNGFRKTEILNKAIVAASGDYLIFTDGDCIPRNDFIEIHTLFARAGYFLSGGYVKLSSNASGAIVTDRIDNGDVFDINWLKRIGEKGKKLWKLNKHAWQSKLLNLFTPTKATWNGHNASGWKADIIRVNGFDERMKYGGLDRELGERLFNAGIKSKQIRFSAVVVHLDHPRGYAKPESIKFNKSLRVNTRKLKITRTPYGIIKENE